MRYGKRTGYDSIIGLEAEKTLEAFAQELAAGQPVEVSIFGAARTGNVLCAPGTTLGELVTAAGGVPEGRTLKAVHVGYPIGGVLTPEVLREVFDGALFEKQGLCPGSLEIHLIYEDVCMAEYLSRLCKELQAESCGRCVYCREGMRQLRLISDLITKAKGTTDDLTLITDVSAAMSIAGQCLFGRATGSMLTLYMKNFGEEVGAHVTRKRCAASTCAQFVTYHILGSKCQGCGACLDACEEGAIEGGKGYIHVIDGFACTKCGECIQSCQYGAIVKAGSVKPRTPDKPIRVGTWRGM